MVTGDGDKPDISPEVVMTICRKCILPDSYPGADFVDGVCSFCRRYTQSHRVPQGKDKLIEILQSKPRGEYDCVVPISGGKDSSYALFYVVTELGLKPLAVFFDSGFSTEIARQNIERLCKRLSVDLVIGKASGGFRLKAIIEAIQIGKHTGDFFRLCGNCENNARSLAINEAKKKKIPFIVWGATEYEHVPASVTESSEAETFREWYDSSGSYVKSMWRRFIWMWKTPASFRGKLRTIWHFLRHYYYIVRDNIDNNAPVGWRKFNPFLRVSFRNKDVAVIYLYDFIDYDIYRYVKVLRERMGWEAPMGQEARMDCQLHFIINYQHYKNTAITSDGFVLANLVRMGALDRDEAMSKEEKSVGYSARECERLMNELNNSQKER